MYIFSHKTHETSKLILKLILTLSQKSDNKSIRFPISPRLPLYPIPPVHSVNWIVSLKNECVPRLRLVSREQWSGRTYRRRCTMRSLAEETGCGRPDVPRVNRPPFTLYRLYPFERRVRNVNISPQVEARRAYGLMTVWQSTGHRF